MLIRDLLTEKLSAIIYHSTGISTLYRILNDNQFRLTPDFGTSAESDRRVKNRAYYMSFSRSPINDYHHSAGGGNCVIVVDGDAMNRDGFVGRPIDYWGGIHNDEMEDRLYHREPIIPDVVKYIKAIHAMPRLQDPDRKKRDVQQLRKCYILAKQYRIPMYVYTDANAYRLLDRRRAVPISSITYDKDLDTGKPYSPVKYRKPYAEYMELLSDVPNERLSKSASERLYTIRYDSFGDAKRSLSADIHNDRRGTYRDDLDKFLRRVHKLGLGSVEDILDYIREKRITD